MLWQDYIFSLGSILLSAALLPSVVGKDKPSIYTSASTGGVLYIFAVAYLTLGLYLSALVTVVTASLWATMLIQKLLANRRS